MSTTTVCQFLSGFLVGVVLCLCIFSTGWNISTPTIKMGIPLEVVEVSFLARIFGNFRTYPNRRNGTGKGYKSTREEMSNKAIISCIVPLLGDFDRIDQLESGILVTWIESCDHVVFLRKRKLPKSFIGTEKILQKLHYRRQTQKKISFSYFYANETVSEVAGNKSSKFGKAAKSDDNSSEQESWLTSQFKAIEFSFKKYSDTDIFILTASVEDIVKYFYKHVYRNSSNTELDKLQKVLITKSSFDNQAVFTLDECLVLGRKAVSKLIKMTHLNHCSFENQRLLNKWAEKCIGSSNV